jgi:hypothetical protein
VEGWKSWEEFETCLTPHYHSGLKIRIGMDLYLYRESNAIDESFDALAQGGYPVELMQFNNRKAYIMIIYRKESMKWRLLLSYVSEGSL